MLADKELLEAGPPNTFDNTILDMWSDCPRKLYFFLRQVATKGEPLYFTAGRAWQKMLQVLYQGEKDGLNSEEIFLSASAICLTEYSKIGNLSPDSLTGPRSPSNLQALFRLYQAQYPPSKELWTVLGMELGFRFPFRSNYFLAGSIDGYIEFQPYGLLVLENKTTAGWLSESFISQWRCSTQVSQYIWALSQILEQQPFGCLMNFAALNIIQSKTAKTSQFARALEQRSPARLQLFETTALGKIEQIRRQWTKVLSPSSIWTNQSAVLNKEFWSWPPTGRFCAGGYGLKPCPFLTICLNNTTLDLSRISIPSSVYRTRDPWEPWEREGDA